MGTSIYSRYGFISSKKAADHNDGDNRADFLVTLDTATGDTSITGYNPAIVSVQKTYKLDKGWAVRIKLREVS